MVRQRKPIARKVPLKRSTKPIKRTAIKNKPVEICLSKPKAKISTASKNEIPKLLARLEVVFNRFIRRRDGNFCISCGETKPPEMIQCGHFYSKTYANVRFNEDNCSSECSCCNCSDPNHLVGYKIRLIEKIGQERFDHITWLKDQPVKWDREVLKALIEKYSK
jgi:hypothetical protein